MFGDGVTRDLEPTVEDGGAMWRLFESCMRVFRSGAARCTDRTEACCKRGADDPESDCEPPRYRCHLGCILPKVAAISLLTGRPKNSMRWLHARAPFCIWRPRWT